MRREDKLFKMFGVGINPDCVMSNLDEIVDNQQIVTAMISVFTSREPRITDIPMWRMTIKFDFKNRAWELVRWPRYMHITSLDESRLNALFEEWWPS